MTPEKVTMVLNYLMFQKSFGLLVFLLNRKSYFYKDKQVQFPKDLKLVQKGQMGSNIGKITFSRCSLRN